jgi:uncharacterized protein (AIM24 family)
MKASASALSRVALPSRKGAAVDRIACSWCQCPSSPECTSCSACGAPLSIGSVASESGWREAPRLRDMTEFRVADTTCQIAGEVVPVAEFTLAAGDAVFFEQRTLLWKEREVTLAGKTLGPSRKRTVAGLPYAVIEARGPGRVAVSRDSSGGVVVLPLSPGVELDARGHAFLAATVNVSYDFIQVEKLASVLHGGPGMYLDRFEASQTPGLLLLHGYGNAFQRRLGDGEKILVEPGGFLYKDSSVTMNPARMQAGGSFGQRNWAELAGPGRVGIQSMYHHSLIG